jgi:hypothetical protein
VAVEYHPQGSVPYDQEFRMKGSGIHTDSTIRRICVRAEAKAEVVVALDEVPQVISGVSEDEVKEFTVYSCRGRNVYKYYTPFPSSNQIRLPFRFQ